MDSRCDSGNYAGRLEKYSKRGFCIALPGYQQELVSANLLKRPYVFAKSCDTLFHIIQIGKPECGQTTLHHAGASASLAYSMRHVAKRVTGSERWVVQNHPSVQLETIHVPAIGRTCPDCDLLVAEPASKTGAVVITATGAPSVFHLLFDCALPVPDGGDSNSTTCSEDLGHDIDEEEKCSTFDGYSCTPLAKAFISPSRLRA